MNAQNTTVEPTLQSFASPAFGKQQHAKPHFAQNDRINRNIAFVFGLDRHEPVLGRTVEEALYGTLIHGHRTTRQQVLPAFKPLDIELLTGLDAILLPQLGGNSDLALGRDGAHHS